MYLERGIEKFITLEVIQWVNSLPFGDLKCICAKNVLFQIPKPPPHNLAQRGTAAVLQVRGRALAEAELGKLVQHLPASCLALASAISF